MEVLDLTLCMNVHVSCTVFAQHCSLVVPAEATALVYLGKLDAEVQAIGYICENTPVKLVEELSRLFPVEMTFDCIEAQPLGTSEAPTMTQWVTRLSAWRRCHFLHSKWNDTTGIRRQMQNAKSNVLWIIYKILQ